MKTAITIGSLCILLVACEVTYDAAVMYHKNFKPGTHELLRFDGYYAQQNDVVRKPLYLYRDGSVWFAENPVATAVADGKVPRTDKAIRYSWGNYKVDGDTIRIERFHRPDNSNHYRRITLKGVIRTDAIYWVQREENRQNPDSVNYSTIFYPSKNKPDSSANWTRTRSQYNK